MKINFKSKKQGILTIEIVITLFIIIIMLSFIFIRHLNTAEKKDLERAVNIFETVIYKYSVKSMAVRKSYDIEIDYPNKTLTVKEFAKNKILEKIYIPEKLLYATPYDGVLEPVMKVHTTVNGNLSKSFSIYIFGYSETAKYRTAFYNFQQSKILKINIYKNVSAGKIKYKDILNYHTNEEDIRSGWQKE